MGLLSKRNFVGVLNFSTNTMPCHRTKLDSIPITAQNSSTDSQLSSLSMSGDCGDSSCGGEDGGGGY